MNQKIILKIHGVRCQVNNDEEEIFCRHYRHCDSCCGLKVCECNNKLTDIHHG